jgi:hypothetical protein
MPKAKIIFIFFGAKGGVNSSDAFPPVPPFLVVHPAYKNEAKTLIMTSMTFTLTRLALIRFNEEYTKNKYFACIRPRK